MTAAETTSREISGFALRCAAGGEILEILSASAGRSKKIAVGESFTALIDPASREKADAFWSVLRARKAAFGWELNVAAASEDEKAESMHFAGALAENRADGEAFLIVAARSRAAIPRFYHDLMRLNNEQANSLRAALKDLSLQTREQTERDGLFYDELSRLNNELATAQRELAKKNVELARLNEQKNQFLGIAAHDLRNPLEVLMTYSEFLLEDASAALNAEQVEFIHKIHASSAFMLNLVNNFLDYSKIDAGRFELDLEAADLVKLASNVVERSRVLADKKRIRIIFEAPAGLPAARVDEAKIEQALFNLISNAVKFSPAGGRVEVRLERTENEFVITVRDEGAGISNEDRETLFVPFVSGKTGAPGGEKSTGLGLAIVKKITKAHGGTISFETEPKRGSIFFMRLPLDFGKGKN